MIGPGDVLDIFVWQNPDLSQNAVPVRPDGRISTPLIANMMAAGKTPVHLSALLNQGELSQNFPVHPGDVLVVPESLF